MKRLFVASLVILIIFFGMSCNEKFFRIVLLPDTQNYSESYPAIFYSQTNILMVLSGHVLNDDVGTLVSEGKYKNKVYQVLANYQKYFEESVNGGNGFLQILTLSPNKGQSSFQTYSPYIEEYKPGHFQQFEFF